MGALIIEGDNLREYYAGLTYNQSFSTFDASIGVVAVMIESDPNDLEYFVAIEREQFGLIWALESVYSNAAEGHFCLLTAHKYFSYMEDRLTLGIGAHQGFDFDYRSEAFDGPNHFQVEFLCTYQLSETIRVNAHISQSWAQSDVKRDQGKDLTWGGIGLVANF